MNSSILGHIARFILLVLLQVLVLNHINFLGHINPYLYVLFILLYPINGNRSVFLLVSFLLGITIDMFSDSGGVHAAACITAAILRPVALKSSFGTSYDYQTVKFKSIDFGSMLVYMSLVVFLHHFILFFLEVFNISNIILILKKAFFSSIFTIILCVGFNIIFRKRN